jgi:hypothetical protein
MTDPNSRHVAEWWRQTKPQTSDVISRPCNQDLNGDQHGVNDNSMGNTLPFQTIAPSQTGAHLLVALARAKSCFPVMSNCVQKRRDW